MTLDEVRKIASPVERARAAMEIEHQAEALADEARAVRDLAIHELRALRNARGKQNSIRQVAELVGLSKTLVASVLE